MFVFELHSVVASLLILLPLRLGCNFLFPRCAAGQIEELMVLLAEYPELPDNPGADLNIALRASANVKKLSFLSSAFSG